MINRYEGLCLGGPLVGKSLAHTSPMYEVRRLMAKEGEPARLHYHYVPLLGTKGFWLWEEEMKGTGPWDDIMRVLCDHYVLSQMEPRQ